MPAVVTTKARRPSGRPKKAPGEKMGNTVQISLTERQKAALQSYMRRKDHIHEAAAARAAMLKTLRAEGLIGEED